MSMRSWRPRVAPCEGYALSELLLALLLSLVVVGAVFGLLVPEERSVGVRAEMVDVQQRARVAQDVLARDLRAAGGGPDAGPGAGSLIEAFAAVQPRRLGREGAQRPDDVRSDTISLVRVPDGTWHGRLLEPFAGGSTLAVGPAWGCAGSLVPCGHGGHATVVAFDGRGAFDLFSLAAGPGATVEPLRPDAPSRYEAGVPVAAADLQVYYHDADRQQLRYYDGRITDVPVVDDVVDLEFEYFGDPAPPVRPRPPLGIANCLYAVDGRAATGLATLASAGVSIVPLPLEMLADGPWCGDGINRFDADLLRIKQVRVRIRLQAAAPAFRIAGALSVSGGTSMDARRAVPDYQVEFDVAPRNLNLGR